MQGAGLPGYGYYAIRRPDSPRATGRPGGVSVLRPAQGTRRCTVARLATGRRARPAAGEDGGVLPVSHSVSLVLAIGATGEPWR